MFKVNRSKGQKGFTLVEVIVVAVIVAALAAVAIPLYLSYVDSTRRNSAANAAGSLASFAGACRNSGGLVIIAGTSATCEIGGTANGAAIQIPVDITVTNTDPEPAVGTTPASPGIITGHHNSLPAADKSTYNY